MTISARIKELRKERHMTQRELGELSGLNEVTIRCYEINKMTPSFKSILKIADAFCIEPYELLNGVSVNAINTGEKIREYRVQKGMTQQELGNKLNVSAQQISLYECNGRNPKIGTIMKIAKELNIEPKQLIPGMEETKSENLRHGSTMTIKKYDFEKALSIIKQIMEKFEQDKRLQIIIDYEPEKTTVSMHYFSDDD